MSKLEKKQRYALGAAIRTLLPKLRGQTEVGRELGLSKQRVSQIECEALAKLFFMAREKFTHDDVADVRMPGVFVRGSKQHRQSNNLSPKI